MDGALDIGIIRRRNSASFLFVALVFWLLLQIVQCFPCLILRAEALYIQDPNKSIMEEMENEGISFGESIVLGRGIYREPSLYIPIGVSLIGEDLGSVVIMGDPNNPLDTVINVYSQSSIKNLIICNGGGAGIYIPPQNKPPSDISIEHNLIINNGIGIYVKAKETKHIGIIGNTIVHNMDRGILIKIDPNRPILSCRENIIAFNGKGIGIEFAQQESAQNVFSDFIDLNNIFIHYNDIYDGIYRTWYYENGFQRESEKVLSLDNLGNGNLSKDPFFVDANHGDYHLSSYSPCIDKGDPNSDYTREPHDNGGRINLGVFGNSSQSAPTLDTDNDGVFDFIEGPSDWDNDIMQDWEDPDTVVLPLTLTMDKILIQLHRMRDDANQDISLKDAQSLLPSELPIKQPQGIIPFDMLKFKIVNLDSTGVSYVSIVLPKDTEGKCYSDLIINNNIRYMALSSFSSWESIPFEIDSNAFNESNENVLVFKLRDGEIEDRDGIRNGVFEHIGIFVIRPHPLTEWKDTRGCFIFTADL